MSAIVRWFEHSLALPFFGIRMKTDLFQSWSHHFMSNNGEKMETVAYFIFLGSKITVDSNHSHEIKRHLLLGRKAMTNLDSILKQRLNFVNKRSYSQTYGFSSSHLWMWELDQKEGWVSKNQCFQTVVLEKTLVRPLNCEKIKPVHPKGD